MPTPVKVIPIITAWSFSRLNDYRKCPQFAKYKTVDKLKEPGNDAMARGGFIHKEAEAYTKAARAPKLPDSLKLFKKEFAELRKFDCIVEEQWAFTKDWDCTGWFDKDAWARMIVDVAYYDPKRDVFVVIDHKTGKLNDNHLEQLGLYAMGAFLQFSDIDTVEVKLWYLDQGVEIPAKPQIYKRADLPELQKYWEKASAPMLKDRRFVPKPGRSCQWCFFSAAKNGPCKF